MHTKHSDPEIVHFLLWPLSSILRASKMPTGGIGERGARRVQGTLKIVRDASRVVTIRAIL